MCAAQKTRQREKTLRAAQNKSAAQTQITGFVPRFAAPETRDLEAEKSKYRAEKQAFDKRERKIDFGELKEWRIPQKMRAREGREHFEQRKQKRAAPERAANRKGFQFHRGENGDSIIFISGGIARKTALLKTEKHGFGAVLWESKKLKKLGWQGSNLRMRESKSRALPLGDTPNCE